MDSVLDEIGGDEIRGHDPEIPHARLPKQQAGDPERAERQCREDPEVTAQTEARREQASPPAASIWVLLIDRHVLRRPRSPRHEGRATRSFFRVASAERAVDVGLYANRVPVSA
jgi:hypothetical protein